MSYTEPQADEGQPTGQADGGETGGQPYADYLNRVPEEVRGDIEPVFADWNRNVNSQFEQHASYRKQWEPYESTGIRDQTPEQIQWALQVANAAQNDPASLRAWLDENHPAPADPAPAQPQQEFGTYDQYDPNAQFKQMLEPIQQQMQQMNDRWQEFQNQTALERLSATLEAEIAAAKQSEAARALPADVLKNFEGYMETFGMQHASAGSDPKQVVAKAFADLQALGNQFGTAALQQKVDQPAPAVSGDVADGSVETVKGLREANKIAAQQIRATLAANGGFGI